MFKNKISNKNLAIISLILSALASVLLIIAVKLLDQAFSIALSMTIRITLAAIITFVIFRSTIDLKKIFHTSKKTLFLLFIFGFLGYSLSIYLLSLGIVKSDVLTVSVILSTSPIWTYLIGIIFKLQKFKTNIFLLSLCSVVGVLAMNNTTTGLFNFGSSETLGILLLCLAAIFSSIFYVFRNHLDKNLNSQEISFSILTVASLTSFIFLFFEKSIVRYELLFSWPIFFGLLLGVGLNISANILNSFAFKHVNSVMGAQILILSNVFALIIGTIFYAEYISPLQFLGMVIILGSAYLVSHYFYKQKISD